MLVGPSGVGKSTFAHRHFRETEIVSSDRCRGLVSDDEANQQATEPAFRVFDAILRGRLAMGKLTAADATNLESIPRERLREVARENGRPIIAIVLDVPMDIAAAQNLTRSRSVPPRVLDLHYERLKGTREVLATEGYDAIYEVRAGQPVEIVRG